MTDEDRIAALMGISTATITTLLFKKGIRNAWFRGVAPVDFGQPRVAGRAFTMRFVPQREDLSSAAAWSSPTSTRAAVEAAPEGSIVIADACGRTDSGVLGDILGARLAGRGIKALVTDGAVRDRVGILKSGLPVWSSSIAAPPAIADLVFAGWEQLVSVGGVPVHPGEMIVADGDGGVVIPEPLIDDIITEGPEMEALEDWVLNEVIGGHPLSGIYPINEENRERYLRETRAGAT